MPVTRILVADDEPLNLEIITEFFEGTGFELVCTESGVDALNRLQQDGHGFDLVILDRMMPVMDGIEVLRRIKADEKLKTLPVIMQTAASAPEQVRQGLEAGAFYYLTKPYERATLLTIVQAALEDYAKRRQLHEQLLAHINALQFLERGEFAFKTLREATQLATFIAAACPHPENTVLGLSELLVNAVEHGNLGITYDEKAALKRSEQWEHEVERRAALPENRHKQVRLEFQRSSHSITLRITDQGSGFNWKRFLELDPERAFDPNGRGIALARLLSFASVQYEGSGNIVTATVSLNG